MCQNVPSLDNPFPAGMVLPRDPAPTIRAPSAFTDHAPETGSPGVCVP
jgi:hypothetical protein